jgi:hypothetical protein
MSKFQLLRVVYIARMVVAWQVITERSEDESSSVQSLKYKVLNIAITIIIISVLNHRILYIGNLTLNRNKHVRPTQSLRGALPSA